MILLDHPDKTIYLVRSDFIVIVIIHIITAISLPYAPFVSLIAVNLTCEVLITTTEESDGTSATPGITTTTAQDETATSAGVTTASEVTTSVVSDPTSTTQTSTTEETTTEMTSEATTQTGSERKRRSTGAEGNATECVEFAICKAGRCSCIYSYIESGSICETCRYQFLTCIFK